MPSSIETVFVTKIYRAEHTGVAARRLVCELERSCRSIAADDAAGREWCRQHGYTGYTSYASLDDLPVRDPAFAELTGRLDAHVATFAAELDLDLGGRPLALDSIWINVLEPGGYHTSHIHPHSVVSGTFYVAAAAGAGAIRFEDPRLAFMMAAPPRRARARAENRPFAQIVPKAGTVLLWESWLRHEVLAHAGAEPRISVSFNYR